MKRIIIYTDGGARGNPGPAAAGAVFCNEKKEILKKHSQYLGDHLTNNEAEYLAVISALQKFKHLFGKKMAKATEVVVISDSLLLVKQLNGEYKIKDSKIKPLFIKVWNLKLDFKKVRFRQVSREKNKEADSLVNEILDSKEKAKKLF